MSITSHIYIFDVFELDEQAQTVRFQNDLIDLTNAEFRLLLFLLKNPDVKHEYNELYEEIFGLTGKSQENTIPNHISKIRIKLQKYSKKNFFKNIPNLGYRFQGEVSITEKNRLPPIIQSVMARDEKVFPLEPAPTEKTEGHSVGRDKTENNDVEELNPNYKKFQKERKLAAIAGTALGIFFLLIGGFFLDYSVITPSKVIFMILAGLFYGGLNAAVLILECAYEYDRYRPLVREILLPVFLFNSATVFAGFVFTDYLLQKEIASAFWTGLGFLLIGAAYSCAAAYYVLPNIPIAKARVQTQPAFTAFCKNVFFYFIPLWSFFGLLIFCLLYGKSEITKSFFLPFTFAVFWLAIFSGSLFSTFTFSDKLLVEKNGMKFEYYQLYFALLMIRTAFFFGPTAAAVIWFLICVL